MSGIDGAALRAVRQQAEVSLREVARRSGYSYSHLSKVERGERPVSGAVVGAYLRARVTVAHLRANGQPATLDEQRREQRQERRQTLAQELAERYSEGESMQALAASTGYSPDFVRQLLGGLVRQLLIQARQNGGPRERAGRHPVRRKGQPS